MNSDPNLQLQYCFQLIRDAAHNGIPKFITTGQGFYYTVGLSQYYGFELYSTDATFGSQPLCTIIDSILNNPKQSKHHLETFLQFVLDSHGLVIDRTQNGLLQFGIVQNYLDLYNTIHQTKTKMCVFTLTKK